MCAKRIVCFLSIVCFFVGLNSCNSRGSVPTHIKTVDKSKTSLNWDGTYLGIIPCADCPGIETQITLNTDNTYQITRKYQDRNDDVYVNKGTFTWDTDGSIITLENLDKQKTPTMYKVCENYLLQLDLNGNVITGELADNYVLKKDLSKK